METDWRCPKCKWWITEAGLKDIEDLQNFGVSSRGLHCPKCESLLEPEQSVTYQKRVADKERVSLAMGIDPKDIPAAMKKWPGSRYRADGALLLTGRSEKKLRMKQRGYCEH